MEETGLNIFMGFIIGMLGLAFYKIFFKVDEKLSIKEVLLSITFSPIIIFKSLIIFVNSHKNKNF